MPFIKTRDSVDLYVKDWGEGPVVVLIHGWPLCSDSFDDQAVALAEAGYRVIAYDRRGFGRSGQPYRGYDYDTFADDLADVLKATGVTDASLFGFSMGGGEIARYMSRHGGRGVVKAGLISSVAGYLLKTGDNPDGVDASVFEGIKDGIREDRPHYLSNFFQDFYGVGWISSPVSQEVLDWSLMMAMQAGLAGTLACVDAFGKTDFRPDLPALTIPTLVIHGTADKTVPIDASARTVARAVPHARLIEYSGSPHGTLATDKARVTADMLDFLRA
ncbi:MAG: alpha/beta hydrolase [Sphingomonas sp.]